jgi:plasmid stability protein
MRVGAVTNLTITVDDETLLRARVRAVAAGVSVNALLRDYLEAYAGVKMERRRAIADLLELASESQSGSAGTKWTRDELHERV